MFFTPSRLPQLTTSMPWRSRCALPWSIISRAYGVAAIEAVDEGKFGCMVSLRGNKMSVVPIAEATGTLKIVTADDPVYVAAKKIGVYMGGKA